MGTPEERETKAGEGGIAPQRIVLRLYVTGGAPRSALAVRKVTGICERHLAGRYDLEVIDLYQQPWLAKDAQLVAAPTLVKELPPPAKRFVGVLAEPGRLLADLGIPADPGPESRR